MTIERARIVKGASPPRGTPARPATGGDDAARARRVAGEILAARAEAARILAAAEERAAAAVEAAAEEAAKEARERETARLAAGFLALRDAEARRMERDLDRLVDLAVLLAERLVGEALRVEPARIGELAATALQEARGATRVRIDASPEDVPALADLLGAVAAVTLIQPDPALGRGSLVVHADLGRVDARLAPQLARLAAALREALT